MNIFLNFLGNRVAKVISKLFVYPESDEDSWFEITIKEYNANSKAYYALLQALNNNDISMVINCTCAHDIWQVLVIIHEGITQVKKAKIDLLSSQYDRFTMFDEEFIDDMLTRLTIITNTLIFLDKPINNNQKVHKIIKALSKA